MFPGMADRMEKEISKLVPGNKSIRVRVRDDPYRMFSVWIGGSILASLETFKTMWVSRETWDECGMAAIHRSFY